jgi:glycosyltransferase involved in cell wall biosynthesis
MISGQEAHRIGRALASVSGWTSEMIIVLNEDAADGTEVVARKHGAKVFREPWKGYIAQKNSVADKASQPWLFNLDADEAVSPGLREEIQALFSAGSKPEKFAAYSFPRLSWYCGRWIRHGDWYPDRQTRIWRRGEARWGGTDPHARLLVDGQTCGLRGDLEHYSTDSINRRLEKIIPFSDEFVAQRGPNMGNPGGFDLAIRPFWRFIRAYFVKLGFLDGWQGFYIASHTAFSTLVRYAKVREARMSATAQPKGGQGT